MVQTLRGLAMSTVASKASTSSQPALHSDDTDRLGSSIRPVLKSKRSKSLPSYSEMVIYERVVQLNDSELESSLRLKTEYETSSGSGGQSDIAEERLQSYAKTERASESYRAQYFDPYHATRALLQCKGNPDDSLSELCEVPEQDEHLLPPNFEDEELTSLACSDPLSPLDSSTRGYGIGMYGLNIALTEQNGGPSNCRGTGGSIQWFDPFAMGHDPGRMGSSPPKRNASRDFLIRQRLGGSWSRNSSTSLVNAPLIGTRDRGSSGRFDSIVSWNSVRGSWTSTSFTDVDGPGPRRDVWGSTSSALRSGSDQFQFDGVDGPILDKRQLDEPNVVQGQKASLDPAGRTSSSTLPLTEHSRSSLSRRGKEDFSFRGLDARPSAARYRSL